MIAEAAANYIAEVRKETPKIGLKELQAAVSNAFKDAKAEKVKTPYRQFLSDKLKELARDHPAMDHKERMTLAQKEWAAVPKEAPVPGPEKVLTPYQRFVKETTPRLKEEHPDLSVEKRREMMSALWAEHKAKTAATESDGAGTSTATAPVTAVKKPTGVRKAAAAKKAALQEELKEEEYVA